MYTIQLKLPAHLPYDKLSLLNACFEAQAFSAVRVGHKKDTDWVLEWLCDDAPTLEDVKERISHLAEIHSIDISEASDFSVEETPDRDWLSYSYQQFPPFDVGPFFIYGSHFDGDVDPTKMGLQIDAATAFGSGEHGTTAGCLEAMVWLKDQGSCPWNVLDIGTGSGILAIAAWKLWKTPVLATDNDPECIRVTEHHRILNGIPDGKMNIFCAIGEGFSADIVQQRAPYELVIANILAATLKEMVAELKAVCDENGRVILSGILNEQAQSVKDVYHSHGFKTMKEISIGDWTTLILNN